MGSYRAMLDADAGIPGELDVTASPGPTADQASVVANLNVSLPIFGPQMLSIGPLTIPCDGTISIDTTLPVPLVGDVHIVVNGTFATGATYSVDAAPTATLPFSMKGMLNFAKL